MKDARIYSFCVPGPPKGKGRPRVGRAVTRAGRSFVVMRTPEATEAYESHVRYHWAMKYPDVDPLAGPLELLVDATFPMPATREKRLKACARKIERLNAEQRNEGGENGTNVSERVHEVRALRSIARTLQAKDSRPDWDNVGKIVCDALNGVAWRDDAQVVDARVRKRYAPAGEAPRVRVVVRCIA